MMLKKARFQLEQLQLIIIILLFVFILGVQIGIKHGRELQLEDIRSEYGINFSN